MQIGDTVQYSDNNIARPCEIWKTYQDKNGNEYYDVLLSERNVPFEYIYVPLGTNLTKGNIIIYKKHSSMYEALVTMIDWSSNSAQVRIIQRSLYLSE